MNALKLETKREIIRRVFPDLRYGGDPDVERYFELRRDRRLSEALGVYNGRLRVRYPNDASRVALLRLYRERDPRYASYQESLVLELADKLALRIAANIDLIVSQLEGAELRDAFSALKAVESVLTRFGGDSELALAQLARYDEFARVLDHRSLLTRRALELVREYDAVARADSPADYDFIARSAAMEQRRRAAMSSGNSSGSGGFREERYDFVAMSAERESRKRVAEQERTHYFDPGKIKFSAEEKKRIEIPVSLKRREDKVLVYCAKYWNQVQDPAFDRLVFLYSRKFGSHHYEIFRAVKTGRMRGSNDDEILSAVSGILTTSYSYSVSGDLYMQVMWRRLRSRMQAEAVEYRLAAPGPESRVRAAHAERRKTIAAGESESRVRVEPERVSRQTSSTPDFASRAPDFAIREAAGKTRSTPIEPPKVASAEPRPRPIPSPSPVKPAVPSVLPTRRVPSPAGVAEPRRAVPAFAGDNSAEVRSRRKPAVEPQPLRTSSMPPTFTATSKPSGAKLLERSPSGPEPVPKIRGRGGSISDRVRALSGKAYDVYREIFLASVRDHIHKYLLAHQTKSHGLFDTTANDAEDQVFSFMTAHYDDPFMDWGGSAERMVAESLGFALPSLDPIIEACFKKL